ncbi:hypothetical protein SALBM311S_00816 [Streptomyces alboniger]
MTTSDSNGASPSPLDVEIGALKGGSADLSTSARPCWS